jgi:hypothetical protein
MNATRILKEARPLLWLWCAAALAGALPLVFPLDWNATIYLVGFFFVPVLATLSLGYEFRDRTFSLLLSQPVGRMRIWGEKLSVSVVAIVSAVLIFSLALRATSFHPGRQEWMFAAAWIIAITASATFWTLFTRSAIGGLALNFGVHAFVGLAIPWATLADGLRARGYLTPSNVIAVPAAGIIAYAGLMLWLGGRTLSRFQSTGGIAGDDLLLAGPDVAPGVVAGWLRSRPVGAIANLIRKELRLLRPVWMISLLAAAGWACLVLFGVLYERGYSRNFATTLIGMGVVSTLMIAILAGSMSLGEERTSGTHSWHLTLPVSAFRQWLIKLCMALLAGIVGAGVLPMLIIGGISGSSHMFVDIHFGALRMMVVLGLTFAAFWCACAVAGTVRAVSWIVPAMGALALTGVAGVWAAEQIVGLVFSIFVPTIGLRLIAGVSNNWWLDRHAALAQTLFLAPTWLFAVIQSYRMFRKQLRESAWFAVRRLLPLATMVFVCSFAWQACFSFEIHSLTQKWDLIYQTKSAIEKTLSSATAVDAEHPLQLTGDDLAKAWTVSESTRRRLHNARITVTTDRTHANGKNCWGDSNGITQFYFLATIHLASGTDLTMSQHPPHDPTYTCGVVDAHIRLPGGEGEESLLGW